MDKAVFEVNLALAVVRMVRYENHTGHQSTQTPPLYFLLQAAGGSRHVVFRLLTFHKQVVIVFISLGQIT